MELVFNIFPQTDFFGNPILITEEQQLKKRKKELQRQLKLLDNSKGRKK